MSRIHGAGSLGRRVAATLGAAVLLLVLCSCQVEANLGTEISADGSVNVRNTLLVDQEAQSLAGRPLIDLAREATAEPAAPGEPLYTAEPPTDGSLTGVVLSARWPTVQAWADNLKDATDEAEVANGQIRLNLDPGTRASALQGYPISQAVPADPAALRFTFALKVPGPVLASNATRTLPDGTLEWEITDAPQRLQLTAQLGPTAGRGSAATGGTAAAGQRVAAASPSTSQADQSTSYRVGRVLGAAVVGLLVIAVAYRVLRRRSTASSTVPQAVGSGPGGFGAPGGPPPWSPPAPVLGYASPSSSGPRPETMQVAAPLGYPISQASGQPGAHLSSYPGAPGLPAPALQGALPEVVPLPAQHPALVPVSVPAAVPLPAQQPAAVPAPVAVPAQAGPPPGWYANAVGPGERYWDGASWTELTRTSVGSS